MSKSKAVQSRDAGEKSDLEKAKAEFAAESSKDAKSAKADDGREDPAQGETIVEKVEAKAEKPKAAPESLKKLAPKVAKKKRRTDREYSIRSHAHDDVVSQGVAVGDVEAIAPVDDWRIVSDRAVMIRGRSVTMRAGQIVNRITHNLDELKRMGVVLERVR